MYRLILGLALALGVSAPAGAQVVSAPTNAGSAQRENMADNVITMNRARVDALKEMLFERMEKLLELEQRAQALVAVRKNLRCCQLQGTSVPWNDTATYVNVAGRGQVFLHSSAGTAETKAAVDFNDKFKNEQKGKFDDLVKKSLQATNDPEPEPDIAPDTRGPDEAAPVLFNTGGN